MTLISVLIVLILERLTARTEPWQMPFYFQRYLAFSEQQLLGRQLLSHGLGVLLWLMIPALLVTAVALYFDFLLIELVISVVVLLVTMGCVELREAYKGYLNAHSRGGCRSGRAVCAAIGFFRTRRRTISVATTVGVD